jgi:error-prone DNA polymerase
VTLPLKKISQRTPLAQAAMEALNEYHSTTVFCRRHPLSPVRPILSAQGYVTAARLDSLPDGRMVRVAGRIIIVHTPPTRSGARVMFVTLEDETGLVDVVVFPHVQAVWARQIITAETLSLEGRLSKTGPDCKSKSILAERVLPEFTGPLTDLLTRTAFS